MLVPILLLLLAVPLVELWVILQVADFAGVGWTIVLLVGVSLAGAWLLKQQGLATWTRLRASLERGEVPSSALVDGALIVVGGALLLTPGFVTDAIGLLLLVPPSRAALKRVVRRSFARWVRSRTGIAGAIVTEAVRSRRDDVRTEGPRSAVGSAETRNEDGSPDTE